MGRVRWAAVKSCMSNTSPLAVSRPWWACPYHDACPVSTFGLGGRPASTGGRATRGGGSGAVRGASVGGGEVGGGTLALGGGWVAVAQPATRRRGGSQSQPRPG